MRGKDFKVHWHSPFDPLMATSPINNPGDYNEANGWQYFWTSSQYDTNGMMKLLGGKRNFTNQLDSFFIIKTPNPDKLLGQEAMIHGNEPSHHLTYLFSYSDQPKKGQEYIHKIVKDFYDNTPTGMIGNDDCGQMSAWYILSTLGIYQVNPASNEFVFGAPQVKKAVINLKGGKDFIIKTKNYSDSNIYSFKRYLNNKKLSNPFITYDEIMKGDNLKFIMQCN